MYTCRIPLITMKNFAGTYYLKQSRHGKKLHHILEDSPYILQSTNTVSRSQNQITEHISIVLLISFLQNEDIQKTKWRTCQRYTFLIQLPKIIKRMAKVFRWVVASTLSYCFRLIKSKNYTAAPTSVDFLAWTLWCFSKSPEDGNDFEHREQL